jgi:hypothetical protein
MSKFFQAIKFLAHARQGTGSQEQDDTGHSTERQAADDPSHNGLAGTRRGRTGGAEAMPATRTAVRRDRRPVCRTGSGLPAGSADHLGHICQLDVPLRGLSLSAMDKQIRYPFLRRRRWSRTIGPDLAAKVDWPVSDEPIADGELAALFADTANVHKWAHYLPVYESTLGPYRDRPIRMLEIGVFHGGSLAMWRRYLHPESVIVGIDIDPGAAKYDNPANGVHVRIGGQQDVDFLRGVADEFGPFDVILDDGSHISSHMIGTFQYLFPNALADGGVYLVEDIHANYWRRWRDTTTTFADFTKYLTHAMHAHYRLGKHEKYFRVGGWRRRRQFKVPFATTIIDRIEIRDSITVVHRKKRTPPRSIFK